MSLLHANSKVFVSVSVDSALLGSSEGFLSPAGHYRLLYSVEDREEAVLLLFPAKIVAHHVVLLVWKQNRKFDMKWGTLRIKNKSDQT